MSPTISPTESSLQAATALLAEVAASTHDEAKRRSGFESQLAAMFPQHQWKILHYALGAETQVRFRRAGVEKRGRIDSRHGALIVEYKRDISSRPKLEDAKKQVCEYIAGLVEEEGAKCVARVAITDIEHWHEFEVTFTGDPRKPKMEDVKLTERSKGHFYPARAKNLIEYVDRVLWSEPVVARPDVLAKGFGVDSAIHKGLFSKLVKTWDSLKKKPEYALLFDLWFEHVASCYGQEASKSETAYLSHAYLVLISRVFAGSAIANSTERGSPNFVEECISGAFFQAHFVENFVEEDFFRWLGEGPTLTTLADELAELELALSNIDFRTAQKFDLLSQIYEQIMPVALRKEFGEVFTPAWLANAIAEAVPKVAVAGVSVLDPACGSGSFLRAAVSAKLAGRRGQNPDKALRAILEEVAGFDINPVSIAMAKGTLVIALAELIADADRPVMLPIYLADSLFNPAALTTRNGLAMILSFDEKPEAKIQLPAKFFVKTTGFDLAIQECQQQAGERVRGASAAALEARLAKATADLGTTAGLSTAEQKVLVDGLRQLREELQDRKSRGRNNVWGFVLKNSYRPTLLRASFDVILSNPPWLTISNLPEARYKKQLTTLAEQYKLRAPGSSAHHVEIATVFAVHAVNRYLKMGGDFAFVLPGTIFESDHHDPFRRGNFAMESSFSAISAWDLRDLKDLFKRLSCVIFGQRASTGGSMPRNLPTTRWDYE